jgi:hypothetical protein
MGFDKTPRDRVIEAGWQALSQPLWLSDHHDRTTAELERYVATVLEALLAHPEDVIALLGGEQVGVACTVHPLDGVARCTGGCTREPVYRFSQEAS